jgi:broad specificity phosphatase PhoE
MAVIITYEVHGLTTDNEKYICSGFFDIELSETGIKQAKEMGKRHQNDEFTTIFCSNLQRSYKTAEIAFGDRFPIIKDRRLRELDYGDFTRHCADEVESERFNRISNPFPNGESYKQAIRRVGEFLDELLQKYADQKVLVIGHGATRAGLEYWINDKTVKEAIILAKDWQPGWKYEIQQIDLSRDY